MKFKIKAYNLQELGQRENQEDSLYPALGASTSNDRLFILCDGMGGHEKGEVASSTVCQVLSSTILSQWHADEPLSDDLLQQALSAAYDALDAKDDGAERKMGTTLTFLCLHAKGATVAHIGDSRVYQLRPASKESPASIVFRTQDHSLVNDLVKIGEITPEEAKHHPQKNVITRAMQPCQEHRAKADIAHLTDIQSGDYFYMCSDGMLEQSTDENILNIITKLNATDEQKVEMLRSVTEENKDNHTAHLIHIEKVQGETPVVAASPQSSVNGTWVQPEFDKPRKKRKPWPILLAVLLLVIIAAGASYFFFNNKTETKVNVAPDSTKVDSAKVKHSEPKSDSARKKEPAQTEVAPQNLSPSSPSAAEHENLDVAPESANKPQKVSNAQTVEQKVEHKRSVINKFVKSAENQINEKKQAPEKK